MCKEEIAEQLRKLFIETVNEQCGNHNNVGLLLSGGVDSNSILYALFELGIGVSPYTFHLEGYESKDLESSRKICKKYGLKLTEVSVPRVNVLSDFKKLYKYGCHKKAQFETKIHYLHIFPVVKEDVLFYGLCADRWYGLRRNVIVNCRDNPLKFKEVRRKMYDDALGVDLPLDQRIADDYGIILKDPYSSKKIYDFFQLFDWEYLNKPYQKWVMVEAFDDYFKDDGHRRHLNFQIGSI